MQPLRRPPVYSCSRRGVRGFYLALTAMMIVMVLAGFWPYFSSIGRSAVARPWPIHLHGAVFSGWMILLAVQSGMVYRGRTATHRRLGRWGAAASFILLPIGDMVLFGGLLWAAIASRRQPQMHKRFILLATVALMFAPVVIAVAPLFG